jgi:hypothetical protein
VARLGHDLGRGRAAGGVPWGLGPPCYYVAALCSHAAFAARVRRNRKEEEERRRERKERKKGRKKEKISKHGNF